MSLLSFLRKVIWAPAPEDNPDVSETQVLLASLDLRLKDCERISWRNDKRITRAFGPIPIDADVDKKVDTGQPAEQPAAILPREGEPTLDPLQFQQVLQKGVD
ncbi:unnamed protein product [marine sediment metagenome]|uniref:Uncharacterized protein n=1 Tax=marine sediment metagenome TaxID=412755 RepID=X1QEC6_9ZZZZ